MQRPSVVSRRRLLCLFLAASALSPSATTADAEAEQSVPPQLSSSSAKGDVGESAPTAASVPDGHDPSLSPPLILPTSLPTATAHRHRNENTDSLSPPLPFEALFAPSVEEYDFLRFDPRSFSGAPLGGWARATRSRLAALPIRLVSGYGYGDDEDDEEDERNRGAGIGMEALYYDEEEVARMEREEQRRRGTADADSPPSVGVVDVEIRGSASGGEGSSSDSTGKVHYTFDQYGRASLDDDGKGAPGVSPASSSALPAPRKRTRGPHFVASDVSGRPYVCRTYEEDELAVESRIDSAFRPARTVYGGIDGTEATAEVDDLKDVEVGDSGDNSKFKLLNFLGDNGGSTDDMSDSLRHAVAELLNKMGLEDLALDFEGRGFVGGGEGGLGEGVDTDGLGAGVNVGAGQGAGAAAGGGGAEDPMVRAIEEHQRRQEAGMVNPLMRAIERHQQRKGENGGSDGNDGEGGASSDGVGGSGGDPLSLEPPVTIKMRMTEESVLQKLSQLRGLCSQIHLGWWSYEWCYEGSVRQFHVQISQDPALPGYGPKYEITDVTNVGEFDATTLHIEFSSAAVSGEDKAADATDADDENKEKGQIVVYDETALGHGGPTVTQEFVDGDVCEDAGRGRRMSVELRCCTEEEIENWFESKKRGGGRGGNSKGNHAGQSHEEELSDRNKLHRREGGSTGAGEGGTAAGEEDEEIPLAVLVAVQEDKDEICKYRSRVCTPLLCPPKPVRHPKGHSEASQKAGVVKGGQQQPRGKNRPPKAQTLGRVGALDHPAKGAQDDGGLTDIFESVFGEDLAEGDGSVKILMTGDPDAARAFENLVRSQGFHQGDPGFEEMKNLLTKVASDQKSISPSIELREGESIRQILRRTLAKRPCLAKNSGWWTYEFCYGKKILQYHAANLIDASTGFTKQRIESEHKLGEFDEAELDGYPDEEEHMHVINATVTSADLGSGTGGGGKGGARGGDSMGPGGNGAVFVQDYAHGDICDQDDVAESVIKGGNIVEGSVERSSAVRFSCGKTWDLVDIKEDSTCHYIIDVTVPDLCQHPLFKAKVTKTQVVKCLPL